MVAEAPLPSVRWIRAGHGWLRRHRRTLLLTAGALLLAAWVASGIYTVGTDETAAVRRFGALVSDAVAPGIHWSLPGGIDEVEKVRTGEVLRTEVEGDWEPELALVTADENLIEATLVVQYRIHDLGAYLYGTEDPEQLVEQAVRSVMVEAFAATGVDDVLTSAKAAIQNGVREKAQDLLDGYGSGLTLVSVNLQSVSPPPEAAGAFRSVSDARAEAAQAINRARGESERALSLAGGEAGKLGQEAQAAADTRERQARGAAERFESLLRQYRQAPEQARTEIYHRVLQEVLPRARVIVLAPGEKPRVDVQLIEPPGRRGGPPPPMEEP